MKISVLNTYDTMSAVTADVMIAQVQQKPDSLICLPSGDTPTGTLKNLVAAAKAGNVDFSKARFVGLDEWVGMDKDDEGGCQHYVYENFFKPLDIRESQVTMFNAKAQDLEAECKKVDNYIFSNGPLDIVLVGVGMNGHIGLNEPGISPDLYCHVVELEQGTKQVAQKYFAQSKTLDKGITLGLHHIMDAKSVIVIANGQKKAGIIQKILQGSVTPEVPGSILQKHRDCYFFLDEEAASQLILST